LTAIILLAIVAALVVTALAYQQIGLWRDARRCVAPGRLLAVDGLRLHLFALGRGAPPVVFVSGIAASCLNWSALQRAIATHTHAVTYDRPGLGWSDLGPKGLTAASHATMLRRLLATAGIGSPVVLVAHSFGAFVAQLLADEDPGGVAGIVLVDPVCWQEWIAPDRDQRYALRGGSVVARIGALLAALGIVRLAVGRYRGGSERMGRAILGSFGVRAVQAVSRVMGEVGKMPPDTWDAIQAHWSRPRAFLAMAHHFAALPASAREVRDAEIARARRWTMPLVVLGASNLTAAQRSTQEQLARQSTAGRQEVIASAGHWIHLDRPELVRDAILDVVRAFRSPSTTL
jgi:pimeloyl-ACP methyl ester carboxylesterase